MTIETTNIIQKFRKDIIKYMSKNNITQKQLADVLGVHYTYISKCLTNNNISLITMVRIANALDLVIDINIGYKHDFNNS